MNILEKICANKRSEVKELKEIIPIKKLENSIFYDSQSVSLKTYLKREDKVGVIAEIKRKSPSKFFTEEIDVEKTSIGYMQSGASALSVLTDQAFFGGSNKDLEIARKFNYCPILRKDFIIDEYQLFESKSIGADCILLIAKCVSDKECLSLAKRAKDLGLEVLLEIQSEREIDSHLNDFVDIVGVNNRNLENFETDIQNSFKIIESLPKDICKISESGIKNADDLLSLKSIGFDGFLIGGHFMNQAEPVLACKDLIDSCKMLVQ